jgi:hypothetical protein
MPVVLAISLLTSCSVNNYKPISLKYQDTDYAAYTDGERKIFLLDLLNNSKWHNDVAKCDCDYTVMMRNDREIFYHSECGTFIDYDLEKSLTVSEEDKHTLNGYFVDIICTGNVHFFDENHRCTACGYTSSEHVHTGDWMPYNQNSHYYEYTCGCTLSDKIEKHVYSDGDTFCNICGYDTSDEPPCVEETIFLRNLTGCEWLNVITAEDIAEIKIISGAVGVAPGNLSNIQGSTDEAVIARIFEEYYQLNTTPISKTEGPIDGGGGVTVNFILKN